MGTMGIEELLCGKRFVPLHLRVATFFLRWTE